MHRVNIANADHHRALYDSSNIHGNHRSRRADGRDPFQEGDVEDRPYQRERMLSYYKATSRPKLVVVTCILPVKCTQIVSTDNGPSQPLGNDCLSGCDKYKCSLFVDELYIGINSLRANFDIQWVGWPRIKMPDKKTQEAIRIRLSLAPVRMIPVYMTDEEIDCHMSGFCRKVVWTNFHNMPRSSAPFVKKAELIHAYESVNSKFASVIEATHGDIFWVMGHELMLLPQMLRKMQPDAKIGFFLHIPFPVEHYFFTMPNRRQLLEGMLGADIVGFQTYDFFKSFLSCAYRLMGKVCNLRRLEMDNRVVTIDEFPMGIDYEYFIGNESEEESRVGKLRKEFDGSQLSWEVLSHFKLAIFDSITTPSLRTGLDPSLYPIARLIDQLETVELRQTLIVSSDRLDESSEIAIRISAYRLFLERNPDQKTNVVFLLLVQPPLFPSEGFNEARDEINQMVTNLNGNIGTINWQPIVYLYGNLTLPSIKRILLRANICMAVPLKSGMGLLAKEYVVARYQSKNGVLILSENSGAAKELNEAMLVNPYDSSAVADAIARAIDLPLEEQSQRLALMQERLQRNDVCQWANSFVNCINEAHQVSIRSETKRLAGLCLIQVVTTYRMTSGQRLLIFDYDGTLAELSEVDQQPDEEILAILSKLCADPKNRVVINSGRDRETLEKWFKNVDVDIAAEHGIWVRKKKQWQKVIDMSDMWKSEVSGIIENLFDNIEGINIVDTDYSLQVIISNSHEQYNSSQSLIEQLRDRTDTLRSLLMGNPDVRIIESARKVEVKNTIVGKGRAILNWLHPNDSREADYGFILSIGDDYTDEDTFRELPKSAVTIKVGMTTTEAKYYLIGISDVRMFLHDLIT